MEKMKVLQMLEDGKITASEAAKLLQAVETPRKYTQTPPPSSTGAPRDVYAPHRNQSPSPSTGTPRDVYTPHRNQSPPPGPEPVSEIGRKIETFARDMEPKIARLTESVVEKTAGMADRISKSFSEASRPAPPAPPMPPTPVKRERYESRPAPSPATSTLTERSFEAAVFPEYNELIISGLNGDVLIKGYNGDKISARVFSKAKRHNAPIELTKFGNKYFLKYDEDEFEKVVVDAYVPESMFNRINVRSVNGKIDVSTLKCDYFCSYTSNDQTTLRDIEADDISIENENSKINAFNISGKNGRIENFNGAIQAELLDISKMKISTFNAPINVSIANFERHSEYSWRVETNNGKLIFNLPTHPLLGYDLKAQNTLGDIKIGLTGLSYSKNQPALVEARSIDYSDAPKKVSIHFETSNAPLIVN